MQAKDITFSQLIQGSKQFVIPVFQRDYRWTGAQCEQLWNDITNRSTTSTPKRHFIGSIVYMAADTVGAAFNRWLVVDGQQRLTSLTLLMIALRDYMVDTSWSGNDDDPTPAQIDAYFLQNKEERGGRKYKLVLRRNDDDTLRTLIDHKSPPETASELLIDAYQYFLERISEASPARIFSAVSRLSVVDVVLDRRQDDPQLVFESLNSTGVDLSPSDLIRNYILMRLPEHRQIQIYEDYWRPVENSFRQSSEGLSNFLRDYTALRKQALKQIRWDDIYVSFKETFPFRDDDRLEVDLAELSRLARHYATFYIRPEGDSKLDIALRSLRQHGDVSSLLVMCLFDQYDQGHVKLIEFVECISFVESYLVRRAVCGLPTNSYWMVFARLAYRLRNQSVLDDLRVGFALRTDHYWFPTDDIFRRSLVEDQLYVHRRKILFHVLKTLENWNQKEPSPVDTYTIEHVMPQTLSAGWKDALGEGWDKAHDLWLNRLGNLTLTAYNSRYSNRSFSEKKGIEGGFSSSAVRLNEDIRGRQSWTADEMRERGDNLSVKALQIWRPLDVNPMLVEDAKVRDLKVRAARRSVDEVSMTEYARGLFQRVDERVRSIDGIIATAERNSVCYHSGSDVVLEIIPHSWHLKLMLDVDYGSVADPFELSVDATSLRFFKKAAYTDWKLSITVSKDEDVGPAAVMVREGIGDGSV